MRGGRRVVLAIAAACAGIALAGCGNGTVPGGGPSGLDLPSVGPSTALTVHEVDGITIALPAGWRATREPGAGLSVSDPGGGAGITVQVREVLGDGPAEASPDAASYLETALPFLVKEPFGIDVTESLKGRARSLDVPGADDAARLDATGARADEPVDCTLAAAQVGPNMAIVIGTDVEPGLWEQVLAGFRVDPAALQPG